MLLQYVLGRITLHYQHENVKIIGPNIHLQTSPQFTRSIKKNCTFCLILFKLSCDLVVVQQMFQPIKGNQ